MSIPAAEISSYLEEIFPQEMTERNWTWYYSITSMLSKRDNLSGQICQPFLEKIQKIKSYMEKYCFYNTIYEDCQIYSNLRQYAPDYEDFDIDFPGGNPQLLVALCSGYSKTPAKSPIQDYTQELEEDIKGLIKYLPLSLTSTLGETLESKRPKRKYLTPFILACINPLIPISICQLLFEKCSDVAHVYKCYIYYKGEKELRDDPTVIKKTLVDDLYLMNSIPEPKRSQVYALIKQYQIPPSIFPKKEQNFQRIQIQYLQLQKENEALKKHYRQLNDKLSQVGFKNISHLIQGLQAYQDWNRESASMHSQILTPTQTLEESDFKYRSESPTSASDEICENLTA